MTIDELLDSTELLEEFMNQALSEAEQSVPSDVPIGALIVHAPTGEIIGRGHNERESLKDSTCHAEVTAVRQACASLNDWRLNECVVFSTLEPCVMCAGTLSQSRIGAVVFGAYDELFGAAGSIYNFFADPRLPSNPEVIAGIRGEECSALVSNFFAAKR